MSEVTTKPMPYRRLSQAERQLSQSYVVDTIAGLRRVLPLGVARFERRLASAMAAATRHGCGFHLGGFAARRALASKLMVDVDPASLQQQLQHRFRHGERVYNIRDKFLGAGDWTPLLRPFERTSTYREIAEIVQAEFDYRQTRSYTKALERMFSTNPVERNFVALSSPAKIEAYFRQTAELCRSVQQFGIIRRKHYGWRLASFTQPLLRLPWIEIGESEIGVAVGPAGELYRFASGKHRTAAAKILGLNSMPVEIRLVHCDWLARHMTETGLCAVNALSCGIEKLTLTAR